MAAADRRDTESETTDMRNRQRLQADLLLPWLILAAMVLMLAGMVTACLYAADQIRLVVAAEPPVLVRTILYGVAIVTFPITNLLRHIMVRLNQTMPGDAPAKSRYLMTVLVSLSLAESPGIYGLVLFILGDDYNTLYIFSLLSLLAMFLYRPKLDEYHAIVETLEQQHAG